MREIKFRVWDISNQEFCKLININYSMTSENMMVLTVKYNNGEIVTEYADDFELMQYTGLKDKNGKEIYEGDIVDYSFNDINEKGLIKYITECGGFILEIYHLATKEQVHLSKGWANDIQVIGNKYENPELLGDTNERS